MQGHGHDSKEAKVKYDRSALGNKPSSSKLNVSLYAWVAYDYGTSDTSRFGNVRNTKK